MDRAPVDPNVSGFSNTFQVGLDSFMEVAMHGEFAKRGIRPADAVSTMQATEIAKVASHQAVVDFLRFVGRGQIELITGRAGGDEVIHLRLGVAPSTGVLSDGEWGWVQEQQSSTVVQPSNLQTINQGEVQ